MVENHPLRALLVALGYAWAASSYSRNDYDVSTGVQDSHALAQLFCGLVGNPDRVYMTGASMGGHVTAVVIEQYPKAGTKPAGDDFLDPAEVADPEFGCAFTDGAHLLGTPCP